MVMFKSFMFDYFLWCFTAIVSGDDMMVIDDYLRLVMIIDHHYWQYECKSTIIP